MPTENEIRTHYKTKHDTLSFRYYTIREIKKDEFDLQHGKLWSDMKAELISNGYLKTNPAEKKSLIRRVLRL